MASLPRCSLGDKCRWSSSNSFFYLADSVSSIDILIRDPGLVAIHHGEILFKNDLAAFGRPPSSDTDADEVQETQEDWTIEGYRLIVLVESLRADECAAAIEQVKKMGLRASCVAEFWDWRVMEMQPCPDTNIEALSDGKMREDFLTAAHGRFLWAYGHYEEEDRFRVVLHSDQQVIQAS